MARCDSYYYGECTWGACELAPWVGEGWGNGADWVASARSAGFGVTDRPTLGAVVGYGASSAYSPYGHVAVVTAVYGNNTFQVREMNYAAWNQYDTRVSSMFDVEGFILPPGVAAGSGGGSQGGGAAGAPVGAGFNDAAAAWGELQGNVFSWGVNGGVIAQGRGPWPNGGLIGPFGGNAPAIGPSAVGTVAHAKGWALWQLLDPVKNLIQQIPFGVGGWLASRADGVLWGVWQQISGNVDQEVGNLSQLVRAGARNLGRMLGGLQHAVDQLGDATVRIVYQVIPQQLQWLQNLVAGWVYQAEVYAQSLTVGEHGWAAGAIGATMQYAQSLFGQAIGYAELLAQQDARYAEQLFQEGARYAEQLARAEQEYSQQLFNDETQYADRIYEQLLGFAQAQGRQEQEYTDQQFGRAIAYARAISDADQRYTDQLVEQLQGFLRAQGKELQGEIKAITELPCLTYCSQLGSLGQDLDGMSFESLLGDIGRAVEDGEHLGTAIAEAIAEPMTLARDAIATVIGFKGCG